jgi:hypothetical protein
MAELQPLSPALWGLAETALLRGDHDTAADLCDRGRAASARVGDAAYLFPFLLTGLRARLARGEVGDAERWLTGVAGELAARSIPGTLVAAGGTNREIAARLFLSPKTVAAHIEHILTKLGAGRRAEIAAWVAALPAAPGPPER